MDTENRENTLYPHNIHQIMSLKGYKLLSNTYIMYKNHPLHTVMVHIYPTPMEKSDKTIPDTDSSVCPLGHKQMDGHLYISFMSDIHVHRHERGSRTQTTHEAGQPFVHGL